MTKNYILLILLCPFFIFSQDKLRKLDKSDMETSVLFAAFPVIDINEYQANTNSTYSFFQAYKAISDNDLQNRLSNLSSLESKAKIDRINQKVSLAILNSEFEVIKPNAYNEGDIIIDAEGYLQKSPNSNSIYDKNNLSILAPLQTKHKGLDVVFHISNENIFNTTSRTITNIKVDFGNNDGFKTLAINTNIPITYPTSGSKIITSELTFSDGSTTRSYSTIKIKYSNQDLKALYNRDISTFTSENTAAPNLMPYGEANDIGTGEYEIFLSSDGILDKPIFLIDGFDPGDGRPINGYTDALTGNYINGIYDLLDFDRNGTPSNLADEVIEEGFDVVILNFPVYMRDAVEVDGGADFIERNAMLLVELIGIINGQKVGSEENVVIGPSMGGLISRYALNFMENTGLDHDTRLWLSFDSPHNGANVPIGFQYLFNKMAYGLQLGGLAGDQSVIAVRPLVDDLLRSAAAKQMLTDHFDSHITSGTSFDSSLKLPQKDPWSSIFYSGLNALTTSGFPENLRKVAIINGSGIGNPYKDKLDMDIEPDFLALNVVNLPVASGFATGNFSARFTPNFGEENTTGSIDIDATFLCFCDFSASATVEAEMFSDGIDAAPGGLFDIAALTGDFAGDPLIEGFFAGLKTDFFNFIPSVSAMALQNDGEINWYHDIDLGDPNARTVQNNTPFVNWYMPDDNELHVTLTNANVEFALSEIILETLSTQNYVYNNIKLEQNPITDELTILSNTSYEASKISIIDSTGKVVYDNILTLNNRTRIPLKIASGLYVIDITTKNNSIFRSKILVK